MLENLQGFHIEPTNICTLQCPRCTRTKFIEQFPKQWKNQQLDLQSFKKFIDIDIKSKLFYLCGNYGDPIYYSDIFEMLHWIKEHDANVTIVTNGSYKSAAWWNELRSILNQNDTVVFAIDGVPSNFTEYRINADWKSIELGITTIVKYVNTTWKFIPFKFNETSIEQARALSKDLGMTSFEIAPSNRWESPQDPLKSHISDRSYEKKVNWFSNVDYELDPKCKTTNYQHFISADGYYMPCCFAGDHRFYYASEFYKNKQMYNISTSTISSVIESLTSFYDNLEKTKPKYCTFNCPQI